MTDPNTTPNVVGNLDIDQFSARLAEGLPVRLGPFNAHISASTESIVEPLYTLYRDYPLLNDDNVFSFHVRLEETRSLTGIRPRKVRFLVDGRAPHEDMPVSHALPVLEWGLNLVIAMRAHNFMMLHAAALEHDNQAILLPAEPGQGKSTLCAGLALRDWRLFSDEFGLVVPGTTSLVPIPRPIVLKNDSIDVIRQFEPCAEIGPQFQKTRKGTVAHVKPPTECVRRASESASARWILFPQWQPSGPVTITEVTAAEGFMQLATNAFNYEILGEIAFQTISNLVSEARCLYFEYSDLDDAVTALTDFIKRNSE